MFQSADLGRSWKIWPYLAEFFQKVWSSLVWFGLVWSGLVWPGLAWFGFVLSGLVWSGLAWSGIGLVWYFTKHLPKKKRKTDLKRKWQSYSDYSRCNEIIEHPILYDRVADF